VGGKTYLIMCCASAVRHRQLLTVFALSVRYEAPDVSLAISSGILPRLMHMHDTAQLTSHAPRLNDIGCVLATASMHLLQILAITSRSVITCCLLWRESNPFSTLMLLVLQQEGRLAYKHPVWETQTTSELNKW